MTAVSNTGPLIALAKIDRLKLLQQLFSEIIIPSTVLHEIYAKHDVESARLEQSLTTYIKVVDLETLSPEVKIATKMLDPGERDAVALAHQKSLLLVIDDRLGRQAAVRLGLSITGVAGLAIKAFQNGFIDSARILLEDMRSNGYWLSDELIEFAVKQCGEEKAR